MHYGVASGNASVVDQKLYSLMAYQLCHASGFVLYGFVVRQVEEKRFVVVAEFFFQFQCVFLFAHAAVHFETVGG